MIRAVAVLLAAGAAIGSLIGGLIGCQIDAASDPRCARMLTTTRVQYVGHAFGRGEITLRAAAARADQIEGGMVLYGEQPEDPPLQLTAIGTCRDGIARLRLGGAYDASSDLRILGGRFVMVDDAELLGHRFGMWRAEIVPKSDAEPRELHGYFRERTEDEEVAAK